LRILDLGLYFGNTTANETRHFTRFTFGERIDDGFGDFVQILVDRQIRIARTRLRAQFAIICAIDGGFTRIGLADCGSTQTICVTATVVVVARGIGFHGGIRLGAANPAVLGRELTLRTFDRTLDDPVVFRGSHGGENHRHIVVGAAATTTAFHGGFGVVTREAGLTNPSLITVSTVERELGLSYTHIVVFGISFIF